MIADDLRRLDEAFRQSGKAGDALFSQLLASSDYDAHAAPVRRGGKPVYSVEPEGEDIGHSTEPTDDVGALLKIAGLGPEMRKLRKLHEHSPPAELKMTVPSEPWVARNEAASTGTPTSRAQACLRLLQPNINVKPWATDLARRGLARLMLDFPVLTHPRFVWDFESSRDGGSHREPLPMVNVIAMTPNAALPCPLLGFTHAELKSFALHPVVAIAMRIKSPVLESRRRSVQLQGSSLAQQSSYSSKPRMWLAYGLLHLERLHHESNPGATLLCRTNADREKFDGLWEWCFQAVWRSAAGANLLVTVAFLEEFKLSSVYPPRGLGQRLASGVRQLFARDMGAWHGASPRTPDAIGRFDRLVDSLVSVGAFESQSQAAHAMLSSMFPSADESPMVYNAASGATTGVAEVLIGRWLKLGVGLDELSSRIRRSHGDSTWDPLLRVLETESDMNAIISAAPAPPTNPSASLTGTEPEALQQAHQQAHQQAPPRVHSRARSRTL